MSGRCRCGGEDTGVHFDFCPADKPFTHAIQVVQESGMFDDFYFFEGHSGPLAAGLARPDPAGYSWFEFEAELPDGCFILNTRLGFTVQQIEEALNG